MLARVALEEGTLMSLRRAGNVVVACLAAGFVALAAACSASDDIRTVADFDANPCALFTEDAIKGVVGAPYLEIQETPPTLASAKADQVDDLHSCVYSFEVPNASIPGMTTFTVTVSHQQAASQPLAICVAGANTKNDGYKLQDFGDVSCTTPSSDLWMKIGEHYFHVVLVPQPGFSNPVEQSVATSPVLLAVGKGAADRLPKT
jgi:hypothetical protein